jgi:hypothetical protein
MRERWTDDRMDDLVKRVDEGFAQVHEDITELRRETTGLGAELRQELKTQGVELRGEMKAQGEELRREMKALGAESRREGKGQGEEFRQEMKALGVEFRREMKEHRVETNQQFAALNRRFDTLQTTLLAIGGTMLAATFAGFVSLLVSHFA